MTNYGLLAYREVEDLKRRVESVEKRSTCFKNLKFGIVNVPSEKSVVKTYHFSSAFEQMLDFEIVAHLLNSSGVKVNVFLNNVKVRTVVAGQNLTLSFQAVASEKDNVLKVEFTSQTAFSLSVLNVKISGIIDYAKQKRKLTAVNLSAKSIVLFGNGNEFQIFDYDGENLNLKLTKKAKDCAIAHYNGKFILFWIDEMHNLFMGRLGDSFNILNQEFIDENVLCIACPRSAYGYTSYGVKGNRVYKYFISDDLSIVKTRLDILGKEVYSSPNVENAFIVCDASANAKLIIE